jgi:filamentous hemagglutinin family protein
MRQIEKTYSTRIIVHAVVSAVFYYTFFIASNSIVFAGPEGAEIINGMVSFQQNGLNTVITASDKSIVNYKSFDIARPEAVQFVQPHSNASVLNRINSANPTHIDGTLSANGRVFFVNPAGVYIGNGAKINVNQLVASGLNISDSDFIKGRYHFSGGQGSVENRGDITAEKVHLIGKQVANYGTINCPGGYVAMAVGDRVFLGKPGNDLTVQVDPEPLPGSTDLDTGVRNEGTINAAGGQIVLAAAGDIYSQAISNVGTLSASVQNGDAGKVKLIAKKGNINNKGSIKTTSNSGKGGKVTTEGNEVINSGTVDVTGGEGGQVTMKGKQVGQFGTVLADGTNSHGGNVTMLADEVVTLGSESLTTANARLNGNGGDVTVSSSISAIFLQEARIEAKGGSESGDGGFVELSADESVYAYGLVDTSATNGTPGSFLIDPFDIIIRDNPTSDGISHALEYDGFDDPNLPSATFPDYSNSGIAFQTPDSNNFISGNANEVASGYIDSILETGSNVILQAIQDITIDPIVENKIEWDTSADFILQAGKDITFIDDEVPSNIGSTGGGSIHLEADSPHNGDDSGGDRDGTLTVESNVTLSTDSGDITLIGADFDIFGEINAGGGNINISQSTQDTSMGLGQPTGNFEVSLLTDEELDNIKTTGTITIGQATTAGSDGAGTDAVTITAGEIILSELSLEDKNVALVSSGTIDDVDDTRDHISTSGTLTLTSGGAIGGNVNPNNTALSTNVGILTVTTTGENDIRIRDSGEGGDTTYSSILTGGGGSIYIDKTTGNLIAGTVTTTGDTYLYAREGSILDTTGIVTADGLWINSNGGSIGTSSAPLTVDGDFHLAAEATGDVYITEADDVTLWGVDAENGRVYLEAPSGRLAYTSESYIRSGSGSLTMVQAEPLDTGDFLFNNQANTDLTLQSTEGSVTSNDADQWQSITATAQNDIMLEGNDNDRDIIIEALYSVIGNISVNSENHDIKANDEIKADAGGISFTANNGKITTTNASAMTGITLESSGNITTNNKLETNEGNISIHSKDGDLIINDNVTASKGGVSLIADGGKIYTELSDSDSVHLDEPIPSLNAQIIGYSDQSEDIGVGLPFDENQKAAIVLSSVENLKLGTGAILSANGAYDPAIYDDLAAVNFEGGDPIDVAIYVGSYEFESQTGGNVTVDSAVDIASSGTMVIDAENTVMPFSDTFTNSWRENNDSTNRLEVVSRTTQTLNQAVDIGTLPYTDQVIQGKYPDWLGDSEYVLRGKRAAEVFRIEAEVPRSIEAAPINYLNEEDEKYVSLPSAAEFIEEPEPLQLLVIREGKYVKAQRNMVLKRGDEIKTPRGMTAFIHFEDGSEIIIMSETDIVIENPTIFTRFGKIIARVRKKFKVRTKYVTAGVKGTLFTVDVSKDEVTVIKMIERNIVLNPNDPNENLWSSVSLGPGKQVRIRNRQEPQIEMIPKPEYEQIIWSITSLERDIAEIPKVTEGIAVLRDYKFGGIEGTIKDDYPLFNVWH